MSIASELHERRETIRHEQSTRFVDAAEFCALATSHRILRRHDLHSAHLRGLIDVETGEHFYAKCEQLTTEVLRESS